MRKINVLKDAQDMVVIENLDNGNYIYAVKPSLNIMEQFYKQSISDTKDANIPAFQTYWKFVEGRIKGSNTFLALRLDKLALRPNGLWIPGLLEAKVLDNQGKLKKGFSRNYGLVIYNNDEPNKQTAEVLVSQAKELSLELPLIVPFRALDYVNDQNKKDGIKLCLLNSKEIIQGKEAQDKINSLDYQENSGVHELYRNMEFGDWCADSDNLSDSNPNYWVDWVCGETTQEILEKAHPELSERKYGKRIRKLIIKQKEDNDEFKKSLKR